MKPRILFLLLACVAISSCTTLEDGGGKVGTEYADEPAVKAGQLQQKHNQIQRGIW